MNRVTRGRWLACMLMGMPLMLNAGTMVTVNVVVRETVCAVNNGEAVDVDFGDVVLNRIDWQAHRMKVPFDITCHSNGGAVGRSQMTVELTGTAAAFDATSLETSMEGLAIAMYLGEEKFTPGSALSINNEAPQELWAVPVKNADATLTPGYFTASATLKVSYF